MPPAIITEKLSLLPNQPGIYRFLSTDGEIVYIGKAKNLRHRVRSYFMESHQTDYRLVYLVPAIADVEWVVTHTEAEALILEDKLIKTHRPKFNIQLKDDKSYPYFKLSVQELFPRLTLVREIRKDGSLYFGPYVSVTQARTVWHVIKRHFPLRQSKRLLDGTRLFRPCLNYQLKRCLAPCAGKVTSEDYGLIVDQVQQILKGNYETLIESLKANMLKRSEALQFEEAAVIRDQIQALRQTLQKQRIVSKQKIDRDVFALVRNGGFAGVQVLFVRNGILLSDDFFSFRNAERYDDPEIIRSTFSRLYIPGTRLFPAEILLPFSYADADIFEAFCRERAGAPVNVLWPQRGDKRALLDLARKNAEQNLAIHLQAVKADEAIVREVQAHLKLKNQPQRVECFDISGISGTAMVGSMVVWEQNRPVKGEYRKYKIKAVLENNDYAAMMEVLGRRYRRALAEGLKMPDLILIDGGKGQLAAAIRALSEIGVDLTRIEVIGLAKGRSERRAGVAPTAEDFEYVVKPGQKNPIRLKRNSATLYFLQNIRDEAHRFAIHYHRQLRGKTGLKSILEEIPGIGAKKRRQLLTVFRSLQQIRTATVADLAAVPGLSVRDSEVIVQFFQRFQPPETPKNKGPNAAVDKP
jgi:excinuclease ABC subunit C